MPGGIGPDSMTITTEQKYSTSDDGNGLDCLVLSTSGRTNQYIELGSCKLHKPDASYNLWLGANQATGLYLAQPMRQPQAARDDQ